MEKYEDNSFSLRLTLDPEVPIKHYETTFMSIYKPIVGYKYGTVGLETLDKCGDNVPAHIHLHFISDESEANIRKRLQRHFKEVGEERKGNALYSLKSYKKKLSDITRFFGYALKQNGKQFDSEMVMPGGYDIDLERERAYEEWSRNLAYHVKNKKRMLDKQSTYDKLEIYLEAKLVELNMGNDVDLIRDLVIEFYKENRLSANFKTMEGYVNTYRLIHNLMSKAEARDRMKKLG